MTIERRWCTLKRLIDRVVSSVDYCNGRRRENTRFSRAVQRKLDYTIHLCSSGTVARENRTSPHSRSHRPLCGWCYLFAVFSLGLLFRCIYVHVYVCMCVCVFVCVFATMYW